MKLYIKLIENSAWDKEFQKNLVQKTRRVHKDERYPSVYCDSNCIVSPICMREKTTTIQLRTLTTARAAW